jgi:hypothetical protein
MSLYSLTHLTGRKRNADRKIIIATIETSKAGFLVAVVGALVSIPPTAILTALFGPVLLLLTPAAFIVAALVLFRGRSNRGLKLPMYRMLLDRNAAKKYRNQILVCGVPIPAHAVMGQLVQSSEPMKATPAANAEDASKIPELTPAFGIRPTAPHEKSNTDLWD